MNKTISSFVNKPPSGGNTLLQNAGAAVMNSMNGTAANFGKPLQENITNLSSKVPNLRLAIEQLDLIPEHSEKDEDENKINNTNLFKNFKIDKHVMYKESKLDDLNTFNSTIMSSKNWGENNLKEGNKNDPVAGTNYFKPSRKNVERELGRSIMDTKLPRARLPNRFLEQQIISKSNSFIPKRPNNDINE